MISSEGRLSFRPFLTTTSISIVLILLSCLTSLPVAANSNRLQSLAPPPMLFESNKGQFDSTVDYIARNRGYTVALSHSPVIELFRFQTQLPNSNMTSEEAMPVGIELVESAQFRMRLVGVNKSARATPMDRQVTLTHYIAGGSQPSVTDVPNFTRVRYKNIIEDIDVEYYGDNGRLEYDFIVHPGGNPASIQMLFDGAQGLTIDEVGNLVIKIGEKEIIQRAPTSYQVDQNGNRSVIPSAYTIERGAVGFELAAWDSDQPLIIDPVIEYSGYYGGAGSEIVYAADLDSSDNIYVISGTSSAGLATPVVFQDEISPARSEITSYPGCTDCTDDVLPSGQVERIDISAAQALLITKFSPDGKTVIWSTYFNVPAPYWSLGLNSAAVSGSGEVAFGVSNAISGLPLVNETQVYDENQDAGYVAKLNSSGNALVFGTYLQLGDYFFSWIRGLDVSSDGKVAVSGMLSGTNGFPTVVGIPGQSCIMNEDTSELYDGFVALFDTSGTLAFSSCLGGDIRDGSSREALRAIRFGINDHLNVAGYSSMSDYPMVNPVQATKSLPGARLMTISQIDPTTGELVFSTWFGPSETGFPPTGDEYTGNPAYFWVNDIISDSDGNIIVTGLIDSLSYPTVNALQSNIGTPKESTDFLNNSAFSQGIAWQTDFFLTKLHPDTGIVFSTYLGGSSADDSIVSLATDADDNIYFSGITLSDDFPVLNATQPDMPSDFSAVLAKVTPKGALAFSTYIGGSSDYPTNTAPGIAINSSGKIIVAGSTGSADFPVVGSATTLSGRTDNTLTVIDQSGDTDTDGDGVPDVVDDFPGDDTEWRNLDGDLFGDNADPDDDGDEVADASDRFPQDGSETVDSDEDGAGDNLDEFDADPYNYFDFDDDSLADFDPAETDDDDDGVDDANDAFDFDATEFVDSDRDGLGDNGDLDDDDDGLPDILDPDRLNPDIPVVTFEQYNAHDTSKYKSPWPEGFSSVDGTDLAWTSASDQSHSGKRSFGSRVIDHNQATAIQYTATFEIGFIEFWYKVDSEHGADIFTYKVDGQTLISDSGDSGWVLHFMPIAPGEHTLEWNYSKNGAVSTGSDAAWIDDLKIIGNTIFESGFE